jgi:sigma-B regulation protein RsbU (phosphoserine phosphatase)
MLKLSGTNGIRSYSWILEPGRYEIGRKKEADFYIPHRTVSRKHAVIDVDSDSLSYQLTDLNSHNGTYVNGKKVEGRCDISAGDEVMFGSVELKLIDTESTGIPESSFPSTRLTEEDPHKSLFLPIDEALKPLPKSTADLPELLPTLFEMARVQDLTEPRDAMLNKSLEMIAKVIPSERLVVLFVNEDQSEVTVGASRLSADGEPGELILSRTIVNEVITNKNSILIGDPREDPRFAEQKSIIMSHLKSAMAVPLFDSGRVLGILYTDSTSPFHQYNDDYMRIMAIFGNLIASRLLGYELVQERQEKQIIESELNRAASIQQNLLSTELPMLDDYEIYAIQEPSRLVGGDLYDMRLLPDNRLLFLVADVSGKGMGAALLMSNILASFRILYNQESFDLIKAVKSISLELYRYSSPDDFATMFIGLLDSEKNTIQYINCGHNPPYLIPSDGEPATLEPTGTMIGAFDFVSWEVGEFSLDSGEFVFIFTDGVTEASSRSGFFGEERLKDCLVKCRADSPENIADNLMEEINNFVDGEAQSDDITVMILKRKTG